jgi:hypothetical protein
MKESKMRDEDESAQKSVDQQDGERRAKLAKAGYAVGIGSAAIVAALLYASKAKKPRGGVKQ